LFFYRVPNPNEALVISGAKGVDGATVKVVKGKGAFVLPWKQRADFLSLDVLQAEIQEKCVTRQGITLLVEAVAMFKVGDAPAAIAAAATRFLDQQDQMELMVGRVLAGHLRSSVGGLTIEEIIQSRNTVAQQVLDASHDELEKMGLVIDAFQIQEITDDSGYINNIAAPHAAAIERDARIAAAAANQAAAEKEQEAKANVASFERDSQVKQAAARADVESAKAEADQAGPLSEAKSAQAVTDEQTELARRQAERRNAELDAEIRRPAEAEAFRIKTLAQAEKEATELRAEALREGNLELVLSQQLADNLPAVTEAIAASIASSNLTVVNGAEGINELLVGAMAGARALIETFLRSGNRLFDADPAVATPPAVDGETAARTGPPS
jgi:flotillin